MTRVEDDLEGITVSTTWNPTPPTPTTPTRCRPTPPMANNGRCASAPGKAALRRRRPTGPDIADAYTEHGYVFEGVVEAAEIHALRAAVEEVVDRAPVRPRANVDTHGCPAIGRDHAIEPFVLVKPSDPWGGTDLLAGRHPTKMTEPVADTDAGVRRPSVFGMCMLMPEALRTAATRDCWPSPHRSTATTSSRTTTPSSSRSPALARRSVGTRTAPPTGTPDDWHQDIHGFNFQVQLYAQLPPTAVGRPGSHRDGRADHWPRRCERRSDRLPDAVG